MAALTGNADGACVSFAALCCRTAYTQAKELQLNAALSELVSSSQCSIVKYDTRDPQVLASIPIHACGAMFTLCATRRWESAGLQVVSPFPLHIARSSSH